jgi:hypothetical protein
MKSIRATNPNTRRVSVTIFRTRTVESNAEIVLAVPAKVTNHEIEQALVSGSLDELLLGIPDWKDQAGSGGVISLGHGGVKDEPDYQREPYAILWMDEK